MNKIELTEKIKKEKPLLKDTSIKQYVRSIILLYEKLRENEEDKTVSNMDLFKNTSKMENVLSDYHYTTARNFYTSAITLLSTEEKPNKEVIRVYEAKVKSAHGKYIEENETGIISLKQSEAFKGGVEQIDILLQKLKEDNNMMVYIIFKMLKLYHIRNEIATLQIIPIKQFNKLKTSDKVDNNYIVLGSKRLFISRNGYKTDKKYGEIIFDITDKEFNKELRTYIKTRDSPVLFPFPETDGINDKKKQLSNLLIYNSQKYIGKKIGSTLMAKIMLSSKYIEQKSKQDIDAKTRGHSVSTMNEVYVKKMISE
tara:strand:+ start:1331 stop:2266 length:936 start_codon:yes stop_codon:yes gene_type:complete